MKLMNQNDNKGLHETEMVGTSQGKPRSPNSATAVWRKFNPGAACVTFNAPRTRRILIMA
jgi:hypothetical protein